MRRKLTARLASRCRAKCNWPHSRVPGPIERCRERRSAQRSRKVVGTIVDVVRSVSGAGAFVVVGPEQTMRCARPNLGERRDSRVTINGVESTHLVAKGTGIALCSFVGFGFQRLSATTVVNNLSGLLTTNGLGRISRREEKFAGSGTAVEVREGNPRGMREGDGRDTWGGGPSPQHTQVGTSPLLLPSAMPACLLGS